MRVAYSSVRVDTLDLFAWMLCAVLLALILRRAVWRQPQSITSVWGVIQVTALALLLFGIATAHGALFPMRDPCDVCFQLYPDWVCYLRLCF